MTSQQGVCISHLLFADDSLLFCRATVEEYQNLLTLLEKYEAASGQAINREKTSLFFSKNTRQDVRNTIQQMLGARVMHDYERTNTEYVSLRTHRRGYKAVGPGKGVGYFCTKDMRGDIGDAVEQCKLKGRAGVEGEQSQEIHSAHRVPYRCSLEKPQLRGALLSSKPRTNLGEDLEAQRASKGTNLFMEGLL
ncbi:hypothetical protein SO802_008040 [Lithocarpus litseifolius]|uniref:Reverse transcriptase domain-containing protein n=1 Tax=Lithocarpus litseifolius TaxID=425828 RepID=A0AAW2DA03_9ROSI